MANVATFYEFFAQCQMRLALVLQQVVATFANESRR